MEYTANLNLKKPEQDDFYNIENENDNMDKIDTEIAKKADKTEALTKTNTTAFTPTEDYQPATKKYVDDNKTQIADNLTTEDSGKALSAKQGKILNNNKVDKVSGKGLSANDFTAAYKTKLDNLDSSLSAKAPAYSYSTTDLTAGTSALATGKLYFVYE